MIFRFEDCEVDVPAGELRRNGRPVTIQAKPFLLLVYLIRNRDRLVEYDEILDELWHATAVGDAAPRRAMKSLRRAIGDDGVAQRLLRTVRGRGYRFVGDIRIEGCESSEEPTWVADLQSTRFVGRTELLERFDAALSQLESGCGGLLLLAGEGGIGKTRALAEFSERAGAVGIDVHRGVCMEEEGTPSYWPWSQVLRSLFDTRGRDHVQTLLGPALEDLAPLDHSLLIGSRTIAATSHPSRTDTSFRLRDSTTRLLSALARERPILIELDDLHGSDLESLQMLQHLCRDVVRIPLLLVGAFRDFEAGLDPRRIRLLAALERQLPTATMTLRPLELEEIGDFVSDKVRGEVPNAMLRTLLDQSGGNPFLLKQLLGLLRERNGVLELEPLAKNREAGRLEAIRLHAAKLSSRTLDVLRFAAILGRRFARGALFLALGDDADRLGPALDEARRAGLIREEPNRAKRYFFVHALVAEALRETSPPEWSARAHAIAATVLEQLDDSTLGSRDAEIAHHYLEAGRGYEEKAIRFARLAGQKADAQGASHEAVMHYERTVQLLEGLSGHTQILCEVLAELGEARTRANDTVGGRESLRGAADLARRLGRPEAFARAAIGHSNEIAIGVLEPASIQLLEEALEWIRRVDMPERDAAALALESRLLSRLAYARYYIDTPQERSARARDAVEIAILSQDLRTHALALKDYHHSLMGAAPARDRIAVTDELAEIAKRLNDHELAAWAQKFRIEDALELGESSLVDHCCDLQEVIAGDLRQPLFRCHSLHHRAMRAHRAGALADAEASAEQGLALGLRSGHQVALQFYGVQLWSLRRDQGRLEELEPRVLEMTRSFPEDSGWRAALAIDYAGRGDRRSAQAMLAQLVDRELESIRSSVNWTTTPALLSEVASRLGDDARAHVLYDELHPHRDGHVIVSHSMVDFGPVDRYLGLCATTFDRPLAIRHLRAAVESCEHSGIPGVAAATRLDLARVLWAGDRDSAIALAGRAQDMAEGLGLSSVQRGAEELVASP